MSFEFFVLLFIMLLKSCLLNFFLKGYLFFEIMKCDVEYISLYLCFYCESLRILWYVNYKDSWG